ncbi:MAG: PIN domain-containing protein [Candidatus Thermoplasmatota archaeon]|jgi:predicted nucleic acid-binding protein
MLFLDTTMLVGAADARDECHDDGRAVLEAIATGKPGMALISDYVLDETLTILGKRRGIGPAKAVDFIRRVRSSPRVNLVSVDAEDFAQALTDYSRIGGALSFTDVVSLVVMKNQGCTVICSHDSGFDRVNSITRKQAL